MCHSLVKMDCEGTLNGADPHTQHLGNTSQRHRIFLAQPSIRLKFCTATPAAPLIRLSRQARTTIRPRTTRTVMSQKLV